MDESCAAECEDVLTHAALHGRADGLGREREQNPALRVGAAVFDRLRRHQRACQHGRKSGNMCHDADIIIRIPKFIPLSNLNGSVAG